MRRRDRMTQARRLPEGASLPAGHRPFAAVLAANVISVAGDSVTQLGVPWYVLESTGSSDDGGRGARVRRAQPDQGDGRVRNRACAPAQRGDQHDDVRRAGKIFGQANAMFEILIGDS